MADDIYLDWSQKVAQGQVAMALDATPFWGDYPAAYDTMLVGGQRVPGLVRVTGKGYEEKLDRKTVRGKHEKITSIGRGPGEIDIDVAIWTKPQLVELAALVAALCKDSSQTTTKGTRKTRDPPPPVDVYHPMLELFGINKLIFLRMGVPEDRDGDGVFRLRMAAIQYVPDDGKETTVKTAEGSLSIVDANPETALQANLDARAKANAAPSATGTEP